jgi:hypothetical protein
MRHRYFFVYIFDEAIRGLDKNIKLCIIYLKGRIFGFFCFNALKEVKGKEIGFFVLML